MLFYWRAKLQKADLRRVNLQEANLWEANLQSTDLSEAKLQNAQLWVANLQDADLRGANLQNADLWHAKNLKVKQLLKARTLYMAKLSDEMKEEIDARETPNSLNPPKAKQKS